VRLPNNAFVLRTILLAIAFMVVCAGSGLAQTAPIADLPWLSLETEPGSNGEIGGSGGANALKHLGDTPSISGPASQSGGLRLGIETEKNVQTPRSMQRSECATTTDEECADYSGLPRSHPARSSLRSLKKPFIGFSITSPLQ